MSVLAATTAPNPMWYFARGSGFAALILLAAAVCCGLLAATRWESSRFPVFLIDELHRHLAIVYVVFLGLHIVTILLDPFTRFGLADVLVPFHSDYRQLWMGLGVVAAEVGAALALSVKIRPRLGYRTWRLLHYGTYALFPVAALHGLGTGSDSKSRLGLAIYLVCVVAVAGCVAMRLIRLEGRWRLAGAPGLALVGVALWASLAWTLHGPLAAGWTRESGTPQRFLVSQGAPPAPTPPLPSATPRR